MTTKLKDFSTNCLFYFSPAILYLYLMFFTGLVPINMFAAYILGFIEKGFSRLFNSFFILGTYGGTLEQDLAHTIIAKFI